MRKQLCLWEEANILKQLGQELQSVLRRKK